MCSQAAPRFLFVAGAVGAVEDDTAVLVILLVKYVISSVNINSDILKLDGLIRMIAS
jgi:hypothetical protein